MSQMNYSEAIEEEGFFDKARRGLDQGARRNGRSSAHLPIEHSTGVNAAAWATEASWKRKWRSCKAKLDAMLPGRARQAGRRRSGGALGRGAKRPWTRRRKAHAGTSGAGL